MPYDDPDPADPSILIGVALPADADATTDMAYVFAEEFARMGYDVERLMRLFQNPFYAGAHAAYRALGDAAVRQIVEECVGIWGRVRFVDQDRDEAGGEDETLIQISETDLTP
ncbi:MAG: hypothetical protein HY694_18235 [Deltaproteobacteria bacterium]|nr:hypothetical protein [Deltaproteobacteria bacterium]